MKALKETLSNLHASVADIEELHKELLQLEKEMAALEKAGLEYAAPHYREGKYFYLISSMRDGQRERRYIGADPEKIRAALDAIERGKEYDALGRAVSALLARFDRVRYSSREIVDTIAAARRDLPKRKPRTPTPAVPPGGGLQWRLDGGLDVVDARGEVVKKKQQGLPEKLRQAIAQRKAAASR